MSKTEIGSVRTGILSEHDTNNRANVPNRQEGVLNSKSILSRVSRFIPRAILATIAGAGSLATVIGLDPSSSQDNTVTAASVEKVRGNGKMTLEYGIENAPKNTIEVQFLMFNGATPDMVRAIAPGLNMASPFDQSQYQGRFRAWAVTPTGDLGCDTRDVRNGCDMDAIKREIAVTKAAGITPHFTVALAKSDIENWGAGSATVTSPFEQSRIDDGSVLMITPSTPRLLDKQAFAHEFEGHRLLKLRDARLITDSDTNVGRGYANCTREPGYWKRLFGIIYSQLKGCSSDPEAYTIADIMNRPEISGPNFAPELHTYIADVMNKLPAAFLDPFNTGFAGATRGIAIQELSTIPTYQAKGMEFTVENEVPYTTTCLELKVLPAANIYSGNPDGPGYHNILCGEQSYKSVNFPKPEIGKGNYFLLPGMSYTSEFRVSSSPTFVGPVDHPGWKWNVFENPYTKEEFTKETYRARIVMPERKSDKIGLVSPKAGETVGPKSTIQWTNGDTDVFYYEVQVSRDEKFETNPDKAIAAVYWNLVHGGETKPLNSWHAPEGFVLEEGVNYFRARPRVQGDGKAVDWSKPVSFNVSNSAPSKILAATP